MVLKSHDDSLDREPGAEYGTNHAKQGNCDIFYNLYSGDSVIPKTHGVQDGWEYEGEAGGRRGTNQ